MYFPVTDVIGKPVLMLSPFGNIAGTGEYDLFGHLNRVFIDAETSHPYGTTNGVFATFAQATPPGFSTDFRVLVDVLDLNWQDANPAVCANWARLRAWDWLDIRDGSGRTYESRAGSTGLFATFWATPPGSAFQLAMRNVGTCTFTPDATGNCTTSCDGVVQPRSKSGVVAGSYEYHRYEAGFVPFWTPLRFPGQYYDAESDLFENWNRYYDSSTGRYLQPEPMLTALSGNRRTLRSGSTLPAYPYVDNDPLANTDPDGFWTADASCKNLPTESDVSTAAAGITDDCLRKCVLGLVKDARIDWGYWTRFRCWLGDDIIAYVSKTGTCSVPESGVNWCSKTVKPHCMIDAVVHEFAHACGWSHHQGKGVPGDDGYLSGCR
jgi:RHS repeat-associated protein